MQQYIPNNYGTYQPMPQPYADRLAQLQNQYSQAITTPQMTAPQVNQGLLWVSGEVGAKSYLVAPNSTVLLMDSDAQRFYLKSADNAGMPSLRIFEYKEVINSPASVSSAPNFDEKELDGKYVTREEYDGLKRLYSNILERIDSIVLAPTETETVLKPKTKAKVVDNNGKSDI